MIVYTHYSGVEIHVGQTHQMIDLGGICLLIASLGLEVDVLDDLGNRFVVKDPERRKQTLLELRVLIQHTRKRLFQLPVLVHLTTIEIEETHQTHAGPIRDTLQCAERKSFSILGA